MDGRAADDRSMPIGSPPIVLAPPLSDPSIGSDGMALLEVVSSSEYQLADNLLDDSLSELERFVVLISSSTRLHRLMAVKRSTSISNISNDDIASKVYPALYRLISDEEFVIRKALACQLSLLGLSLCQRYDQYGYAFTIHHVIPSLTTLAQDASIEVRLQAMQSISAVCQWLSQRDVRRCMVPVIQTLLGSENQDHERSCGIQLLSDLGHLLTGPVVREIVRSALFIAVQFDPSFRVRKTLAANIATIGSHSGSAFATDHILPILCALSKDSIWSVRKSCVDNLPAMSSLVPRHVRRETLIQLVRSFHTDQSRWIRSQVQSILGEFLFSMESNFIVGDVLSMYTDVIIHQDTQPDDEDTKFNAAFSVSAVIGRLGRGRWHEIAPMYIGLCRDTKFKVRRSLSHSLHVVARIVGREIAEAELQTVFEMFFRDLEEVRIGVIQNFAQFLAVLGPVARIKFLPLLSEIQQIRDHNWRFRLFLASQLGELAGLFPVDSVCTSIAPLAISLSRDRVADVRYAAVQSFGAIISRLHESSSAYLELISECQQWSRGPSFQDRCLYIRLCATLVLALAPALFIQYFLSDLARLSEDRIINVRIRLAHFYRDNLHQEQGWLHNHTKVQDSLSVLLADPSPEIQDLLGAFSHLSTAIVANHVSQMSMADLPLSLSASRLEYTKVGPTLLLDAPPLPTPPTTS